MQADLALSNEYKTCGTVSAALSFVAIFLHLSCRYLRHYTATISSIPLWAAVTAGGLPLLYELLFQVLKRQFGADFLAGLSIVTAVLMGELLVATIIVFMLSIGQEVIDLLAVLNALRASFPGKELRDL